MSSPVVIVTGWCHTFCTPAHLSPPESTWESLYTQITHRLEELHHRLIQHELTPYTAGKCISMLKCSNISMLRDANMLMSTWGLNSGWWKWSPVWRFGLCQEEGWTLLLLFEVSTVTSAEVITHTHTDLSCRAAGDLIKSFNERAFMSCRFMVGSSCCPITQNAPGRRLNGDEREAENIC